MRKAIPGLVSRAAAVPLRPASRCSGSEARPSRTPLPSRAGLFALILACIFPAWAVARASTPPDSLPRYGRTPATARLEGRVLDAGSGHPLVAANIVLAGTEIGTVSQADGSFFIAGIPTFTIFNGADGLGNIAHLAVDGFRCPVIATQLIKHGTTNTNTGIGFETCTLIGIVFARGFQQADHASL